MRMCALSWVVRALGVFGLRVWGLGAQHPEIRYRHVLLFETPDQNCFSGILPEGPCGHVVSTYGPKR